MKTALLVAALGTALTVTPAAAHTCTATAEEPTFAGNVATGRGSHSCLFQPGQRDMTVYVCLEVATASGLWSSYGCQAYTRTSPPSYVSGTASHSVCLVPGALLVRTTAYGVTSLGENDYAESLPTTALCAQR